MLHVGPLKKREVQREDRVGETGAGESCEEVALVDLRFQDALVEAQPLHQPANDEVEYVQVARDLLAGHGGFLGLFDADLLGAKGIGRAKKVHVLAALEISRRYLLEKARVASALTSPGSVRDYLRLSLASREHEVFTRNDGLVIMKDGTKYVSSVLNGGISRIRPGQPAELIARSIPNAASMCYDEGANQLVVPMNPNNGLAFVPLK